MTRKKRSTVDTRALLICLTVLVLQVNGQSSPERCDQHTLGSGSGLDPATICGQNSMCQNNAECLCNTGYFSPSGSETDCRGTNEPDPRCSRFSQDCVYCGANFQGPCYKCTAVIYDGQCLQRCPEGTQFAVEQTDNFNSPVSTCIGTATTQALQDWAIIVIIVLGSAILIVIAILIAALACRCLRRSNVGELNIAEREEREAGKYDEEEIPIRNDSAEELDGGTASDNRKSAVDEHFEIDDDTYYVNEEEREEFFERLGVLREQSVVFLRMLNDMRKRLKELPQTSPAVPQYKNVMRDLTRLLYMLNKKPEKVRIPPDGLRLLIWSEQILNKYLLAQGKQPISSPTQAPSPPSGSPQRFSSIGSTAETDF
ncbi:PREDICTED: uncharacterized protein LOC109581058 [Amphimedon queenslandica]|nr:PREDICTED: uncharacterized protein LOC109581058 [Amphimedon queenslandica]|eukprot:XP_019850374.1 PREDICTED: uncharacterized protein LOC109581058 [Amphimedon queenslandica]